MIKSKFRLWYILFQPLILLMSIILVSLGLWQAPHGTDYIIYIFFIPLFWIMYSVYRRAVIVRIWPDRLQLRNLFFNKTIYKDEISAIELSARKYVGSWSNDNKANAIIIRVADEEQFVLIDSYYRNTPEIKRSLQEYYLTGPANTIAAADDNGGTMPAGEEDAADKFAGPPLLSFSGAYFILMTGGMFIGVYAAGRGNVPSLLWLVPASVSAVFYFLCGFAFFYYKVSDSYLIIRNHFFPWYRRWYRLEDIDTVILQRTYRNARELRINFRDFRTKKFPGHGLWIKHWRALQQRLTSVGVNVLDEL